MNLKMIMAFVADEKTETVMQAARDAGATIIGGCCGTSPAHIKAIADVAKTYSPRNYVQ